MQPYRAFLRPIVAAATILAPAAAMCETSVAQVAQDITYTVINNTTTPAQQAATQYQAGRAVAAGELYVRCTEREHDYAVAKDTTKDVPCSKFSDAHNLVYGAAIGPTQDHTGTAAWDCDFDAGETTMELTFTGSGTGITYSSSCSSSATDDDTTDD